MRAVLGQSISEDRGERRRNTADITGKRRCAQTGGRSGAAVRWGAAHEAGRDDASNGAGGCDC